MEQIFDIIMSDIIDHMILAEYLHTYRPHENGTVVEWLALPPHNNKVMGSNLATVLSVWSLHVLPVSPWVRTTYPHKHMHG